MKQTKSESITRGTNEERDQLTESVPGNAATRLGITIFFFFKNEEIFPTKYHNKLGFWQYEI